MLVWGIVIQVRKFSREMMSQGRSMENTACRMWVLSIGQGFQTLVSEFYSMKTTLEDNVTQHFCYLNGSWEAVDKKILGLLKSWFVCLFLFALFSLKRNIFNCQAYLLQEIWRPELRISPGTSTQASIYASTEACRALHEQTILIFFKCAYCLSWKSR